MAFGKRSAAAAGYGNTAGTGIGNGDGGMGTAGTGLGNGVGGMGTAGTGMGTGVGGMGTRGGAGTGTTNTGFRNMKGFRGRKSAPGAVVENKLSSPNVKFVDLRAAGGRRIAVAGAVAGEKLSYLRANMRLVFYTISHPIHPIRRTAAKDSTQNIKAAATERKRQKIARAADNESRKRALVRERRAQRLNTAL